MHCNSRGPRVDDGEGKTAGNIFDFCFDLIFNTDHVKNSDSFWCIQFGTECTANPS